MYALLNGMEFPPGSIKMLSMSGPGHNVISHVTLNCFYGNPKRQRGSALCNDEGVLHNTKHCLPGTTLTSCTNKNGFEFCKF